MPDLPKYDGTTDPQEHVTSYTCAVKGNDMQPDEIESVLLNNAFIKAHAGEKKVSARKSDIFKIAQGDSKLLREFVIKDKVIKLLKKGHLREFLSNRARDGYGKSKGSSRHFDQGEPSQVINMIMGGTEIAGTPFITKMTKFSITREKRLRNFVQEEAIVFTDEDADDVTLPPNEALVISVMIVDCWVKRILIDSDSSTNIIRWKVMDQLSMLDGLTPSSRVLNRFNMASEMVKAEIILPINAGGMLKPTKFYVIDGDMSYNTIFGRPWIHDMKVVPSTLHLLFKFPTPNGIGKIRGEQSAAKGMFAIESHKSKN
ncbi:uncharacterized protein LOC132038418 [Lycium ferocissimum]|uniref:uncharacterized protein LOC132038418 n=1 Tax=Lycium ferocissimum TaxID=112874 RepID=UPI0028169712|nr:uncharacterized protein LOC132038418 [Lycium ferocissimum]